MAGAFIISRDIFENPIWLNNTEFRLFFLILGHAVWKDEGVRVGNLVLQKGQWLRSYRNLQSDMEYIENNATKRPGKATIQRAINRLVKDKRITVFTSELGTVFTVVNYCKYQDLGAYRNQTRDDAKDSSGTAAGQQRDNKNKDNKENKDKKDIYTTEFEHFWAIYPKHIEKKRAYKCWNTCLKNGHNPDDIILAATNYAKFCTNQKTELKFIKHAATFLGPNKPFLDYITGIPPDARGHPVDEPKGFQGIRDWLSGQGKELDIFDQ